MEGPYGSSIFLFWQSWRDLLSFARRSRRQKSEPSKTTMCCFATATSYFFLATQPSSVADGWKLRKSACATERIAFLEKSLCLRQK